MELTTKFRGISTSPAAKQNTGQARDIARAKQMAKEDWI